MNSAKGEKGQYSAKKKVDYKAKKAGKRKVKKEGSVAPTREVKHMVGAEAHEGLNHKVVDKRKKDNKCTRCGINNHPGKFGRRPLQVLAVDRGQAQPK